MTTKLVEPLKREVEINGVPYTLAITPRGLSLVVKGRRNGYELEWTRWSVETLRSPPL